MVLYADDILLYRGIENVSDYYLLQEDICTLETWILQNYLQLNASKCKYMTISRKRSELSTPKFQLYIDKQPIEKVSTFRYLGVWLTDTLSWSAYVEKSSKAALKQAGMIFRRFYQYCSADCLKQLYLSFVRPHLEYAVQVWDPHYTCHIQALEKVQKFAFRMCYKAWNEDYDTLLARSNLQSLAERRKYLKLCYLFQVLHGHFCCQHTPTTRDLNCGLRSTRSSNLCQPFSRTLSYKSSFFPDTIALWNSLPTEAHSCDSLWTFKKYLLQLPHLQIY